MKFNRILALLLVVLLCFSAAVPALAAKKDPGGEAYPTIYIFGKTDDLYNNIGTEEEYMISNSFRVWSRSVPDTGEYAKEQAKILLPKFAKALFTGDYEDWATECSAVLAPIYEDFVLDKNGKPREGSGVKSWEISDLKQPDGTFPMPEGLDYESANDYFYRFHWDWRLSPLDVADSLRDFIEVVLQKTGTKKINLISRCEGCCVALAYLYKYGEEKKLFTNVLLGSSANGVCYASNIFAGKYEITADNLNRYIGHNFATGADKSFGDDFVEDAFLRAYLRESLCLLAESHSLDRLISLLRKLVKKVSPMIYPGLMMSSYGTCPAYWAMVRDEDYEDAKKLAGLTDNPEWANFVALIDEYHYNVQQKSNNLLKLLQNRGTNTAIICKYGSETLPFVEVADEPSDNTTLLKDASYGATVAKIEAPFSDDYVNAAAKAGKSAYISPDRLVDASTCLFPERTWFLKYQDHDDWVNIMLAIYRTFIRSNGTMQIGDKYGFARFYVRDGQRYAVMTEENANLHSDYYQSGVKNVFRAWLASLFALLRHLPALLGAKIQEKLPVKLGA